MKYYDKILFGCSGEPAVFDSGKGLRAALEHLYLHVELAILAERPQYERFFGGGYACADFLVLGCHGTSQGLSFPLIDGTADNFEFEPQPNHLQATDIGQLRPAGEPAGAVVSLACQCATIDHARLFAGSGFRYYIGHDGALLEDAKILYLLTFFAHLSAADRDEHRQVFSIPEAHEAARRVLPMPGATLGFQLFEIPERPVNESE